MIDDAGIRLAFRQRLLLAEALLLTLPDLATRIAWENNDFAPPDPKLDDPFGSLWVRETYLPGAQPQTAFNFVQLSGIMRYDVFCPAGGGTEAAEALAKGIGDVLRHGTGFTFQGPSDDVVQVSIIRAERGRGSRDPQGGVWYMVPVSITFRAYGTLPPG